MIEQRDSRDRQFPPFDRVVTSDLTAILACLSEAIEILFPDLAKPRDNLTDNSDEMLDYVAPSGNLSEIERKNSLSTIFQNIQQVTNRFFSHFTQLMPKVQESFIDYLKEGVLLTPEVFRTHFGEIMDYFELQSAKQLEKIPDLLDYGGNFFPRNTLPEILERFLHRSSNVIPEQVLFVSYLGDFLLQNLDIYPNLIKSESSRFILMLQHPEYYFRVFASEVLKIITQAQPEIITPHFLMLYKLIPELDRKLLASLMLMIRDLLSVQGENIFTQVAGTIDTANSFIATSLQIMSGDDFEVSNFSCEIFFDFVQYLDHGQQSQVILNVVRLWRNTPRFSTYFMMTLQNFIKKTKLVAMQPLSPEELENASNLQEILAAIESALEN